MPPPQKSSSTGYNRPKRTIASISVPPIASSTSSSYRFVNPRSASRQHPRSPSPPASAYFPLVPGDAHPRFQATPDAEAHFSYSTTLRRHHVDAAGLSTPRGFVAVVNAEATSVWTRIRDFLSSQTKGDYQPLDNGRGSPPLQQRAEAKDTSSATFAHCSIEVSF